MEQNNVADNVNNLLANALWQIYHRPEPVPTDPQGGNLPWHELDFSERMLREHLDEGHGAASRVAAERAAQLAWLWQKLGLQPGARLLDLTCGPGLYAVELARRGCYVTGVDFSPAAIAYAKDLALSQGVVAYCDFVEQDIRQINYEGANFDAVILLYGQLAVFTRAEAQALLAHIARSLKPGGNLCVELLNQERVDKSRGQWWFTDQTGLWGDKPFLHLGERFWFEAEEMSLERFYLVHLETGELSQVELRDQTYAVETMTSMMQQAGFRGWRFIKPGISYPCMMRMSGWFILPGNDRRR